MKKVLITGVAGEVGYALCNELLELGIDVYGIDTPKDKHNERIDWIGRNALFHFIPKPIEKVNWSTMEPVDVVYHFAQTYPSSNRLSDLKMVIAKHRKNSEKIASYAVHHNARVILLSTIEVYGMSHKRITDTTKANPASLFGEVLMTEENLLTEHMNANGSNYLIVRVPSIEGLEHPLEINYGKIDQSEQAGVYKRNREFNQNSSLNVKDLLKLLITAGNASDVTGVVPVPGKEAVTATYIVDSDKYKELLNHSKRQK
ncbi:NAD-dependent epimerase/dehydratase family protein [Pseudalkalibacillus decolorationis]|uniref:NAD-dependent epimerase/dehydratase family protein n=1 Tax=Pseudalkalibacillus decolorationis TaxID=163879 RepID=UPI0021497F67|nr:NAD(P)-dependent oxidoreductase [Pseudalkalibacillus decolorationis]